MARSFNAPAQDHIALANSAVLDVTTQLSIVAWANVGAAPVSGNQATIIGNGNAAGGRNFILDYRNIGGTLQLELSNTVGASFGELRAVVTLSTSVWHSVVFTADWTQNPWVSTCYIDGVSQSVSNAGGVTTGTPSASDTNHFIGQTTVGTAFWSGSLAEIAVYKGIILTAGEAKAFSLGVRAKDIRKSLIGYWPLDGLKSPEPDLSGNANNGTLTGTLLAPGPPLAMFTPRWPINFLSTGGGGGGAVKFRRTLSSLGTRTGSRQVA
jgi:hypothetical protein